MLGYVAAGVPIEAVASNETIAVPEDLVGKRETYVLRVKGDSMIDEQIRDGDFVVVEDRKTADNGEMVIALVGGTDVTLKKFYRDNGRVRLQPANPTMQPIILDRVEVQLQGVVVGVMRQVLIEIDSRNRPIGVMIRSSHVEANQLHHRSRRAGRSRSGQAGICELLRGRPHAVRFDADLLRRAPALGARHQERRAIADREGAGRRAHRDAVQRRARAVAALQEQLRAVQEARRPADPASWPKGPLH